MTRFGIAALTLILSAAPHADVYRCTVNGKSVYQDHPCRSCEQKALDDRNAQGRQRQQALTEAARRLPPPEPIAWHGSFQQDLLKVSALLDHIRVLGRDCEWELKVTPTETQACKAFMLKLIPGGDYVQIGTRIQALLQDEANARQAMGELTTIRRHFEDITRSKEFMMARMGR